jgi:hypothetical protein
MRLELYARYSKAEVLAGFGAPAGDSTRDGWFDAGGTVLGFFRVGQHPPDSHFCDSSRFHWYGASEAQVPECLKARGVRGHLLIQAADGKYVYVADLQHVGMYSLGKAEAMMDIAPPVPSGILAELGALYLHPAGAEAMNAAVASLRIAATPEQRLGAFRSFVESWRGPMDPALGLDDGDLSGAKVKIPPVLEAVYRWAGGCEDFMTAGYFSLVKPDGLAIRDDGYVAVCTECQWCGNFFVRLDALGDSDPEVFVDHCGRPPYTGLGIDLSHFLWLHFIAFNADAGPIARTVDLSATELQRLDQAYPSLPILGPTASQRYHALCPSMGKPTDEDAMVFAADGIMGYVLREGDHGVATFSARTETAVAEMVARLGVDPARVQPHW